jgi:16S rRNA (adenine1518-N6/adenine1519-N6)-dimethyltransferase
VIGLLQRHGLRLDPDLGQHFLLDENLVDLSLREGRVGPDDVVLEIGAGVGVLTRALARRARHVHAVEIDRRLEGALAEALGGAANVRVRFEDAARMDLEALEPAPTRLVANLPYDIATPVVVESMHRLPHVERWCVMVQREVADRWTAAPGGRDYGGVTVQIAFAARQVFRRAVGREVFVPRPRVDSALIALERVGPGAPAPVRALVRAAFAHRRKTLVNTLAAAGADKAAVIAALEAIGVPPAARPAELEPEAYAALARELAWSP